MRLIITRRRAYRVESRTVDDVGREKEGPGRGRWNVTDKERIWEREREKLAWNQAWTLMYCQADIVNALVPGICRVRVCSYPPCDSVIDITFLSVSLVGVRLCAHRNTYTSSWEPCTERWRDGHAVLVPHTTRPRYILCADRRCTEREWSQTRKVIDVRL